jgi:hypothetical protein
MKNALVCIACLLVCRPSIAQTPIKTFIIAGQSNALGGAWPPYPPGELLDPQDSLYSYSLATGSGIMQSSGWEQVRTLWPSPPHNVSFGVEITFAHEMEQRLGEPIAIIKVASNGSNLHEQWRPSVNILYPWLVENVQTSLAELATAGYEPDLAGMLWIQGESDSVWDFWAGQYEANLQDLVDALRIDLSASTLPVALNLLHTGTGAPAGDLLREQQLSFTTNDPYATAFDSSDIPLGPDNLHYPNESFLALGVRFADAFAPVYAGADFNNDGHIDAADLESWSNAFGPTTDGDADADGDTDGEDFLIWQRGLTTREVQRASVPEPSGGAMACLLATMTPLLRPQLARRRAEA